MSTPKAEGDQAREVKRIRFKLADKRGPLELLGKHLKLWVERTENLDLNRLVERMSNSELEKYAMDGVLPDWFSVQLVGSLEGKAMAGKTERELSPADFPIGSLESRAAASAVLERRLEP